MRRDRERDKGPAIAGVLHAIGRVLQRIPRGLAWLPALLWASLIFFFSSQPPPDLGVHDATGSFLTNLGHAPEYGIFTIWITLNAPRREGWPDLSRRVVISILACVLAFAISDEFHQSFTPHRDPSALDVLTDVTTASSVLATIAFAAGVRASGAKLVRALVLGFLACLLAAALATFLPGVFPDVPGL